MILAGIGLSLAQPWPMKLLVDQVLGQAPIPQNIADALLYLPGPSGVQGLLLWVCLSTVLIFLIGSLVSAVSTTVSLRFSQRMTYDLAADLFLHLQKLSLIFHSRRSVGDLMSRVTGDSYCVQTLVNGAMLPVLQSIVTLVMMFVIMWNLEPTITLLSLSVAPFLYLSIRLFGKSMKTRGKERRELEVQMTSLVQQSLSALPAVQAFTREELEHARFRKFAEQTVQAYVRTSRTQILFKLFVGLVTSLGTASVMYVGALYAMDGRITVGTILVFLTYLRSLYDPLNALAHIASTLQTLTASSDRVLEILDTPQEVSDTVTAKDVVLKGSVRFDDVSFGYEKDRQILKNVTFDAKAGETVAIVGPTGAGKTTLVNLLIRFFDPWSGVIRVDDHDLRDVRVRTLRKQIAMVLQDPFIFPSTIAENIAFGRFDAKRDQIVAAAQAANAHEFIVRLPDGYDTVVGERGATLSGGEKQRLSTARAFLIDSFSTNHPQLWMPGQKCSSLKRLIV
jgi:ATP-binding cassette subfamily B protein